MLLDMFSGFDDHHKVVLNMGFLMWLLVFIGGVSLGVYFWSSFGVMKGVISSLQWISRGLVMQTKVKYMGGAYAMFVTLMFGVVLYNLLGLTPYTFSVTSHLSVNLSMALPVWGSTVLLAFSFSLGLSLAHMLPVGAPVYLSPFLALVELVSLLIRPITLAVRLTANLSAGHIVMTLLGSGFVSLSLGVGLFSVAVGAAYCVFEMAVCIIQSYIFAMLPTLYGDEHPLSE